MLKRANMNKKICEEEKQAIGAIYKQYIDTFQETADIPLKTFVKSEILYADQLGKQNSSEKGQLYNPKPLIKLKKEEPIQKPKSPPLLKRNRKKSSNLKALGDELKMLQRERQVKEVKLMLPKIEPTPPTTFPSQENEYTNSTNLFVSNLNPNITEHHLIELFGTYGPLASVKIMWPRNEVSSRSANCGFVAFMSRTDAERALNELRNHEEMRINWGKSVKIPAHPVHIPPELCKLYSPPPPSGLPFNAQMSEGDTELCDAVIKVTIPFDRNHLMLIHRMIEFVIREGPQFEATMMNIERENPDFSFLTDFQSPAHTYYRWKLYSILNGDPKNSWSMKPFRMYKNGSIWLPPTAPNYKDGMPKELIATAKKKNKVLSETETRFLIHLIKHLTISKSSIGDAMVFCFRHSDLISDIVEVLLDSFRNVETNPLKKVARLYLLNDILYNCKIRKIAYEKFQENFTEICVDIFEHFHKAYKMINHSEDRECFKHRVFYVLRAWVIHRLCDVKLVTKLENIFLTGNEAGEEDDNSLSDEPLDGANLLKRSFNTATSDCTIIKKTETNDNRPIFDIFSYSSPNKC